MEKIKELTKEQEELKEQVKTEWFQRVFNSGSEVNLEKAKKGVEWLWSLMGYPMPKIYVAINPLETLKLAEAITGEKGLRFSGCDNGFDAGWVAFYDFFSRIGVTMPSDFERLRDHLKDSGIFYSIAFDEAVFVCGGPDYVKIDDHYRLHCENGPAVKWKGGLEVYFWHDTQVTEQIIMRPETITKEQILKEKNSEVARAMAEKMGYDRYMKLLDTYLVSTYFDPVTSCHYELYDFKERQFKDMPRFLKMESAELNDGTRPYYIEPVDPGLLTAEAARRWQLDFDPVKQRWISVEECNKGVGKETFQLDWEA